MSRSGMPCRFQVFSICFPRACTGLLLECWSPVTAGEIIRPGGGLAVAESTGFLVAKEVIQ